MAGKSETPKKRKSATKNTSKSKKSKTTAKSKKQQEKNSSLKWYTVIIVLIGLIFGIISENKDSEFDINTIPADDNLSVHYIDVGQGDCIFIETASENMLIDCGESSEADVVVSYLQNRNVTKIDYLVGTHPHSDHMGGMSTIVDTFEIGNFYMPYLPDSDIPTTKYFEKLLLSLDENGVEMNTPNVGDNLTLGDSRLTFIAPVSEEYSNTNNYSIGIILEHGENSFIFTGDAEDSAEEEMIQSGYLRDIDVYKAGHHGSTTSSSEEFLSVIKPEYTVIMCGTGNSYNHPNDDALERISEYTDSDCIYRTDLRGTVVAESDGSTIKFKTEK